LETKFSLHSAEPKGELAKARLRFLGDNFAILPKINRRAMHARGLARDFRGAAKRATDGGREFFAGLVGGFAFHFDDSNTGARSAPYKSR
jgi:hypothetical protein